MEPTQILMELLYTQFEWGSVNLKLLKSEGNCCNLPKTDLAVGRHPVVSNLCIYF